MVYASLTCVLGELPHFFLLAVEVSSLHSNASALDFILDNLSRNRCPLFATTLVFWNDSP